MSSWMSILMLAAFAVAVAQGRAVPEKPVGATMDSYGNPLVFLRDKRAPVGYSHRAMMFTGYYRPVRRTNDAQATGVFAQGNAVSGGSYVSQVKPGDYPEQRGPEPIDEPSISSSEAEAAPSPLDHDVDDAQREKFTPLKEQHEQEPQPQQPTREGDEEHPAAGIEAPVGPGKATKRPAKRLEGKKTKKRPSVVESDESLEADDAADDDDEDDDAERDDDDANENDEAPVPFVPFKSNRRRYNNPQNLNNFFPMVFSYPRGITRGGSLETESLPGMITAIANSYSTSKRGVASSVATAYGGAPEGSRKHRRAQPAQE